VDDANAAASVTSLVVGPLTVADPEPNVGSLPIDPPTRARARLMVFLN
jgi:hypothetical protein